MIPDNILSSKPLPSNLLVPLRTSLLEDYEWGGVNINDSSQGLKVVIWKCFYDEDTSFICIKKIDSEEIFPILEVSSVTSLGLSFDQNMRVQLTYIENGMSKLYWYDPYISKATILEFPNCRNICLSLDDNRSTQTSVCDIIVAYQKDTKLYYRQQRDRYNIEYVLDSEVGGNLWQIGMNSGNRFQFMFK